ncbi:hypothetical protein OAS14_02405 [Alphaproteobacteria bacterium]|nr:hypothetical protein [Alphaproteobacteria bacterium]
MSCDFLSALKATFFAFVVSAASAFPTWAETKFQNVGNYDFREVSDYKKNFALDPELLEVFDKEFRDLDHGPWTFELGKWCPGAVLVPVSCTS